MSADAIEVEELDPDVRALLERHRTVRTVVAGVSTGRVCVSCPPGTPLPCPVRKLARELRDVKAARAADLERVIAVVGNEVLTSTRRIPDVWVRHIADSLERARAELTSPTEGPTT
jgi:hypothetical protein